MIKTSSDPHLLKVRKDTLFFNVSEVALYFPCFLPLNPPRGTLCNQNDEHSKSELISHIKSLLDLGKKNKRRKGGCENQERALLMR